MTLLYLDPGSSSYIVQMIAAGALGAWFILKNYWYRIKSFFVKPPKKTDEDETKTTD